MNLYVILNFYVIFTVFLLWKNDGIFVESTGASKNQNVTIQRLTNLLSDFLTYDQYYSLSNTVMTDLLDGETVDEIKDEMLDDIMAVLTTSQYATAMSKATTLILSMGSSAITSALDKLETVMSNNLTPFFNQCSNYSTTLQSQGMKTAGVEKNIYRVVNSFITKKRIKTIFTRVSLQFSSSDWSSLVSALDGIINFSANGF